MDALKPLFLVACVAFVIGFTGYLAVARAPTAAASAGPASATYLVDPTADTWNPERRI